MELVEFQELLFNIHRNKIKRARLGSGSLAVEKEKENSKIEEYRILKKR